MASYAKQAQDETLLNMARRIQMRAYQRVGELLKQYEPARGRQPENGSSPSRFTRTDAADDAGLSERERKTALRIASVDEDEFEALVESDDPPTITEMARRAHRPRTSYRRRYEVDAHAIRHRGRAAGLRDQAARRT